MATQTSPDTTTGASPPSTDVFEDAQRVQDAWIAEISNSPLTTVSMWLDNLPPSLRASIITAPTPPSSPIQARAFFMDEGDDDDEENASLPHYPDPQQNSGVFMGIGKAQPTYRCPYGLTRELRRTRKSSDETQSGMEGNTAHGERKDDGLARADSGVGVEEDGDVGRLEPGMEGAVEIDGRVDAFVEEEMMAWKNNQVVGC
jgi:hypothetical protein